MTLDTGQSLTFVAAYLGLFAGLIDANAINLALPAVRSDLGGGISGAQWTIDAYNVTFAALLLTSGSLGDRYGRRRLLRVGLIVFVVASALCAAAPSLPRAADRAGDAGRGCRADAAAGTRHHRGRLPRTGRARTGDRGVGDGGGAEHRDRADSGRRADRHVGWRYIFWLNIPIGLLALVMTRSYLPESRDDDVSHHRCQGSDAGGGGPRRPDDRARGGSLDGRRLGGSGGRTRHRGDRGLRGNPASRTPSDAAARPVAAAGSSPLSSRRSR